MKNLISEAQLIKNCLNGEKASQFELVSRYSPMLMTVCRRYARDEEMAKDVLQETLIKIFKNLKSYQDTGSFEAWMRKIAVHAALRWLEKAHFRKEYMPGEFLIPETKDAAIFSQLGVEAIIQQIQTLPDGYRTVLNLKLIEDFSHSEIAEILNISESTSRSQYARSRKLLQERLNDLPKKASA